MLTEAITYWFFRLNGCLTIQNFIVHPDANGSQRTDADVVAARFANRRELLSSGDPMKDHKLFKDRLQLFLAEVKTDKCSLNGPWTDPDKKNVQRVLNAIGFVPIGANTETAANALYEFGKFDHNDFEIQLVLVGGRKSDSPKLPENAVQLTYDEMLSFIHSRMVMYHQQKADHQQWDEVGHDLYDKTDHFFDDPNGFIDHWRARMAPRDLA